MKKNELKMTNELNAAKRQLKADAGIIGAAVGVVALIIIIYVSVKIIYSVDKGIDVDPNDTVWAPVMNETRSGAASNLSLLNVLPTVVTAMLIVGAVMIYVSRN